MGATWQRDPRLKVSLEEVCGTRLGGVQGWTARHLKVKS
jgi:hypothetical protein